MRRERNHTVQGRWLLLGVSALAVITSGLAASALGAIGPTKGIQLWAARYAGPAGGNDGGAASVVSPDGKTLFVTGSSYGGPGYGPNDYLTIAYSATGLRLWTARYAGPGTGEYDSEAATLIAVSRDGTKVFVTGQSFGGYGSSWDYATVAYNATTGAQLWAARYTGPGSQLDGPSGLGVSPDGTKVFVTGWSDGTAATGRDWATIAYDATTGATIWTARYNGPASGSDSAGSLAVSNDGSKVFVTGGAATASFNVDFTTVAYRAETGAKLWANRYDGPPTSYDYGSALAVSNDGTKLFATGSSTGGPVTLNDLGYDYATIAYSAATGARVWVERYDGPASHDDFAGSIGLTGDGTKVFVTGTSYSEIPAVGDTDFATVGYNAANGARLWVARHDGPGHGVAAPRSLAVTPNGVIVTGSSSGGAQSGADYDTIVYDAASGFTAWSARYNGSASKDDWAQSVAVSPVSANGGTRFFITGSTNISPWWEPVADSDVGTVAYWIAR